MCNSRTIRPRWRLNVSLLGNDSVKNNFCIIWSYLLQRKSQFPNLTQWWELLVKPQVKRFYVNQGKEQKQLKQGVLKYLEYNLRNLYDNANNSNIIDFDAINSLRKEIDAYREKK